MSRQCDNLAILDDKCSAAGHHEAANSRLRHGGKRRFDFALSMGA
jgi:hypothetical protein